MGLFDGYQFNDTPQGGLIDRLMAQLQAQGAYQPSQGFGQNPMDAQAAMPQNAPPIAVGGYQMPRVGSPADFAPSMPTDVSAQSRMTPEQYSAMPVSARTPQQGVLQPQVPSFLQSPGDGNNLMAGLQSFSGNLHGGLIGALVSGAHGLATGQRNDPRGQQQQALREQYRALVPILGQEKATLAILNPEIGKAMVAQALSGKQYQFTTAPDGTVIRTDAHAGTAEPVYQAGLKPTFGVIGESDGQKTYGWIDPGKRTTTPVSGIEPRSDTVTGPDGKPITIPAGVDRKEFIKKVTDANAKAATGEKTEVQAKSEKFGNKMELAERNIKDIEGEGQSYLGRSAEGFPLVGNTMATNWLKSEKYQRYQQARDNFITALLRDESGAAIGTPEFNRYERELFPQPGESAATVKQKREARRVAIEGMKKAAGPGYKSPTFENDSGGKADPLGIR
jgi:hypothetical protein